MNLQMNAKIGAIFKCVIRNKDGSIKEETEPFHNLVLDSGLTRMLVGPWITQCCVGTGNSLPVSSQSSLDTLRSSTTLNLNRTAGWDSTTTPNYIYERKTWRFAQGLAAGNLSEVGLGWSNTEFWNRALIKDKDGNPTTITVLSDEILDIVAEIRVYPQNKITGMFPLRNKVGDILSTHTFTASLDVGSGSEWGGTKSRISTYLIGINGDRATTSESVSGHSLTSIGAFSLSQANTPHSELLVLYTLLGAGSFWGYKANINPPIIKTPSQEVSYTVAFTIERYTS